MLKVWFNKFKIYKNTWIIKKISLIYWVKYLIYIKKKSIGKFLNNSNFNQIVSLMFSLLMFFIDNCILYYGLLQTFYIYGVSFNFLIYLELKSCSIFIFNVLYSLGVGYLLKHISYRCWMNSDFCYTLLNRKKNTITLCHVLFPFQMFAGINSSYYQSIDLITGYWQYHYPQSYNKYWKGWNIYDIIWITKLIFIWPYLYFAKIVYNLIKLNSSMIHDYNYFHDHPIFKKYFCKLIYISNFITWWLILLEIFIINLIFKIHYYIPLILYIICKFKILIKYFLRYYKLHTFKTLIKQKNFFELQKHLWDDYRHIGFFICGSKIYINGLEETKYLLNKLNYHTYYFKYNKIKWGFHQFIPNNYNRHLSYRHSLTTGLTTSSKYRNILLPTQNPILYVINRYSPINQQFFYNLPNNLGTFITDCEKSDWINDYSIEWQVLLVQDFWQSTKPENMSNNIDWVLTDEQLTNINKIIIENNLEFENDVFE